MPTVDPIARSIIDAARDGSFSHDETEAIVRAIESVPKLTKQRAEIARDTLDTLPERRSALRAFVNAYVAIEQHGTVKARDLVARRLLEPAIKKAAADGLNYDELLALEKSFKALAPSGDRKRFRLSVLGTHLSDVGVPYVGLSLGGLESLLSEGVLAPAIERTKTIPTLSRHSLVVTHAQVRYTRENPSVKEGLDEVIASFKDTGKPVVYLIADDGFDDVGYFTEDRRPDYAFQSNSGEFSSAPTASEITIVGGYFNACLSTSVTDAIRNHFAKTPAPFIVHLPMKAIYVINDAGTGTSTVLEEWQKSGHDWLVASYKKFGAPFVLGNYPGVARYAIRTYVDGRLVDELGSGAQHIEFRFSTK